MEQKKSRWHKKRVDGTKSESVEQNQSRPGIFKESVPYHPAGDILSHYHKRYNKLGLSCAKLRSSVELQMVGLKGWS